MVPMKMNNGPQISAEQCKKLSISSTLNVFTQIPNDNTTLAVKDGKSYIDTIYNFNDKRYLDIVKKLKGNVLILGLGLGCNILRALEKKDVTKVTVIEIDSRVIALFYSIYGSSFKGFEKLEIINMDALDFTGDFDHVFIDIYNVQYHREFYDKNMTILKERFKNSIVHFIEIYRHGK